MTRKTPAFALPVLFLATLALTGCSSQQPREVHTHETPQAAPADAMLTSTDPIEGSRVTLFVQGLSCPLCATNIDKQLIRVPGVRTAQTDLSKGEIQVGLAAAGRPSPAQLAKAVDESGFTLTGMEVH